jgi:hypothetical protein
MLFYYLQASEEERVRMEEPIGWRPVLDPNVPMEEHVRILQAWVNERFPTLPSS